MNSRAAKGSLVKDRQPQDPALKSQTAANPEILVAGDLEKVFEQLRSLREICSRDKQSATPMPKR